MSQDQGGKVEVTETLTIPAGTAQRAADAVSSTGTQAAEAAHSAVDRAAAAAHDAVEGAAKAVAPAAEWLGEQGETLLTLQQKLMREASQYIAEHPVKSVAMAAAAGFLLSQLLRSSRSDSK
jgi:ElaB/YqjD/DUF883 family membrane-anchored ribosome-binding protein